MENRSASVYLSFPSSLLSAKFCLNALVDFEGFTISRVLTQVVKRTLTYTEPPSVKRFVEHLEGIEDWVWTSERSKYALNLLKGRPEKIEEFLEKEPTVRQFVDSLTIERIKKLPKAKLPEGSGDLLDEFFSEGEEEGSSEGEAEKRKRTHFRSRCSRCSRCRSL